MLFPLYSMIPQAGGLQAGGLPDISRWLSEALRAAPPDIIMDKNRIPEGCQRDCVTISGIPSGCIRFLSITGGVGLVATSPTG
jgi:hypothetical protein